ncbi:response regulator [Primorskyibacter sp. S187A]|uniref:response regulator n=1 Tax=Primorskyibacter sp. S187A TaxID=3415130 RepID=UPI003C7A1B43
MTSTETLTSQIGATLPFLRRYARALTGSQTKGDQYAAATLEAILADMDLFDAAAAPKVALFKVFHGIWSSTGRALSDTDDQLEAAAQKHLAALTPGTREVLLLNTIEDFSLQDIATITGDTPEEVSNLRDIAYQEMAKSISGNVLIIEDEAIIAMDLESIVGEMGHRTTGVARTADGAISLFEKEKPDLILSDIQLADGSSGIDAVNNIVGKSPEIPVIFITAYPERLLTGEGPEPAFLISKPYSEEQVRSAVSQAMFFSSTETLRA